MTNLNNYLIVSFFIISKQGEQHKMQLKRSVASGWLQTVCVIKFSMCKRKVSNFISYYLFYLCIQKNYFIFINSQDEQDKALWRLNISCYTYLVQKQLILPHSCFDCD